MTEIERAKRAIVTIGNFEVEGFRMPDGSYRMSVTSAAVAVQTSQQNATSFLRSKALKALLGEDYTPQNIAVEVEPTEQIRGQTRINALPLDAVNAYWHWQSHRGNKRALALCMALSAESLDRRFDAAFEVARSEGQRNQALAERIQSLEGENAMLAEIAAEPDMYREHVARLEEQLRQNGIEPWQIEGGDCP